MKRTSCLIDIEPGARDLPRTKSPALSELGWSMKKRQRGFTLIELLVVYLALPTAVLNIISGSEPRSRPTTGKLRDWEQAAIISAVQPLRQLLPLIWGIWPGFRPGALSILERNPGVFQNNEWPWWQRHLRTRATVFLQRLSSWNHFVHENCHFLHCWIGGALGRFFNSRDHENKSIGSRPLQIYRVEAGHPAYP